MSSNPFIVPAWLMLAVAIAVSFLVYLLYHTLWGLAAYGPWLMTLIGVILWEVTE